MIIHPIFPTPVCFSKLTRNLTNKELKYIAYTHLVKFKTFMAMTKRGS